MVLVGYNTCVLVSKVHWRHREAQSNSNTEVHSPSWVSKVSLQSFDCKCYRLRQKFPLTPHFTLNVQIMKNHKLHHRGAVTHSVIFTDSQIFQYRLQFFVCMFLLLSLSFEINLHKEFCIVSLSTMLVLALDALLSVVFQGHITNACTICLFLLFYPSCHHQKVWYLKVESSPL